MVLHDDVNDYTLSQIIYYWFSVGFVQVFCATYRRVFVFWMTAFEGWWMEYRYSTKYNIISILPTYPQFL